MYNQSMENPINYKKIFALILFLTLMFSPKMSFLNPNALNAESISNPTSTQSTTIIEKTQKNAPPSVSKEKKDVAQAWVWRIVKRYQTAMDRMAKIADRIDKRAKKLENSGVNPKETRLKTNEARILLNEAGDNIILAAASINDFFEGRKSAGESYMNFKNYALKGKSNLKEAKSILREAVVLIEF